MVSHASVAAELAQLSPALSPTEFARELIVKADSDVFATFASSTLFTEDRLHKVGVKIINLLSTSTDKSLEEAITKIGNDLNLLVESCSASATAPKVPRVRFGKTNEMVSILTCGGMRQQQKWGPSITTMSQVEDDCQANFVEIILHSLKLGINHLETARGYGCSELQFGAALNQLFTSGEVKREDILLQTKVGAKSTKAAFRKDLELSFELLQVDYVDFFSVHGINRDKHLKWVVDNEDENNWDVIQEYLDAGKIRHVGFSSHGTTDLIAAAINTDKFSYANIHYHYFGSYTASGDGPTGGNRTTVDLLKAKNMGCFIISPFDKGGMLYKPSTKLLSLHSPSLNPIEFTACWLWQHELHSDSSVHTIVCGAARPSDLDEAAIASFGSMTKECKGERANKKPNTNTNTNTKTLTNPPSRTDLVRATDQKLKNSFDSALGKEWGQMWHVGVPNCFQTQSGVNFTLAIWLYNIIEAFGMLEYARERYKVTVGNREKWDKSATYEENMEKGDWGYCPGNAVELDEEYDTELKDVPTENRAKVLAGIRRAHKLCTMSPKEDGESELVKEDWAAAHDLRPWTAFPERG